MSSFTRPLLLFICSLVCICSTYVISPLQIIIPLNSLVANAQQLPRLRATPPPTPTRIAISGANGKCCFCIYPDQGQRDHERFKQECDRCRNSWLGSCKHYHSMQKSDMEEKMQALSRDLSCDAISLVNNQHGPDASTTISAVEVCQAAFPGCPTNVNDLSCSTYADDASAEKAIKEIQQALPVGSKVELCGSASVNFIFGCGHGRISKRWVISPSLAEEKLGPCPEFGDLCAVTDAGKKFNCADLFGRKHSIECCRGTVTDSEVPTGFWGDQNGCNGRGCDRQRCPTDQSCIDATKFSWQRCVGDKRTGFCQKGIRACGFGGECRKKGRGTDNCWNIETPAPTATARRG